MLFEVTLKALCSSIQVCNFYVKNVNAKNDKNFVQYFNLLTRTCILVARNAAVIRGVFEK